jgi:hypothetical protein
VLSEASMSCDWVKHEVIKAVEREKAEVGVHASSGGRMAP